METDNIIKKGINSGTALEIGPGPGYLGLEWLKKTTGTRLKAVDISPDMINMAEKNAMEYGLTDERLKYFISNACELPFEDESFEAAFSSGSLHEWESPVDVINEIIRVLKPGGQIFISDLKRNTGFLARWFMNMTAKPAEIRHGLRTSLNAAYTENELKEILSKTSLYEFKVDQNPFGLEIFGVKAS